MTKIPSKSKNHQNTLRNLKNDRNTLDPLGGILVIFRFSRYFGHFF